MRHPVEYAAQIMQMALRLQLFERLFAERATCDHIHIVAETKRLMWCQRKTQQTLSKPARAIYASLTLMCSFGYFHQPTVEIRQRHFSSTTRSKTGIALCASTSMEL